MDKIKLKDFLDTTTVPTIIIFDENSAEKLFSNNKTVLFNLLGSDEA